MNLHTKSRRSFLANAAFLTAGFAVTSPVLLFAQPDDSSTDLKENWNAFWRMQNGELILKQSTLRDEAVTGIAKGHFSKTGEIVRFETENLLAQPIWVYWGEKKTIPDDVVITFFSSDSTTPEKLFRLNRFELEGLLQLAKQHDQTNLVTLLKEDTINRLTKNNRQSQLIVKAKVNNNKRVKVESSFA